MAVASQTSQISVCSYSWNSGLLVEGVHTIVGPVHCCADRPASARKSRTGK